MSKQSRKGKTELDVILEQLKRSYESDSSDMLEDDLLESPANEEDAELNEILGRLFSSDNENYSTLTDSEKVSHPDDTIDTPCNSEDNSEAVLEETISEESVLEEVVLEAAQDNLAVSDTESVEITAADASDENDFDEDNLPQAETDAKAAVDNVLNIMFSGRTAQSKHEESGNAIESIIDASPETDDAPLVAEDTPIIEETELAGIEAESYNKLDNESIDDINSDEDAVLDDYEGIEDIEDVENIECIEDVEDINLVIDSSSDETYEDFAVEDEEYEICEESTETSDNAENETEVSSLPRLILSPSQYTFDPLQETIPTLGTNAALIAAHNKHHSSKIADKESKSDSERKEEAFDSNDISLLLKFGYDNEIKSKVGEKKTQQVLLEADQEFTPDSTKKLFGFCGKELTDRKQIPEIKEKYKTNTRNLIILLSIVSTISLLMLYLTLSFEFFSDKVTSFPTFLLMEFVLVVAIVGILYKKLISGFNKLMKLETSPNTLFVFVSATYILYSIFSLLGFIICSGTINPDDLMLFGFCVSIYAVLSLVSDLLRCIKEHKAFNVIASAETLYTAEKQGVINNDSKQEFRIRQTKLISGYFRKTFENENLVIKTMYLIGVAPIISIIVGITAFSVTQSLMLGLSLTMMTLLFSIPISCLFSSPLIHFVLSNCMIDSNNTAFIGNLGPAKMSKVTSLIFRDSDSLEITGYTEIHPSGRTDTSESLKIAYEIFAALGGPLAMIGAKSVNPDNAVSHEIVINQISDNGIDIYFDSSINILLGDKQYMQAHNIKVKTDTNLSTATKGSDRSVIFMAFDGIPKLGFIINSRIKPKFLKMSDSLHKSSIKVRVQTYEPQINDLYYEQNKGRSISNINVIKPDRYEPVECLDMCDGCVISSADPTSLADTISSSYEISRRIKANNRINIATIVVGLLLSCSLTLFVAQGSFELGFLAAIRSHLTSVVNALMLASLIPAVVEVIHIVRNKKK